MRNTLILFYFIITSISFSNELSITPSLIFPSTLDFNYNGSSKVDSESMLGINVDYLFDVNEKFLLGVGSKVTTPMKSNQSGSVGSTLFSQVIPYTDLCYVLYRNSDEEQVEQGVKQSFLELQLGYPILYGINQNQFQKNFDLCNTHVKSNYYFGCGLGTEQNHIYASILYTIQLFQLSGINSSNETVQGTLWFPAAQLSIGYIL